MFFAASSIWSSCIDFREATDKSVLSVAYIRANSFLHICNPQVVLNLHSSFLTNLNPTLYLENERNQQKRERPPPGNPMTYPPYHPFRSQKAKERYLEYYDNAGAKSWPVAAESVSVDTSYGLTFVRVSGPVQAKPLVLLPSTSATSLIWQPNIEALSKNFRVYAVDNIYDFGRSVYKRPIRERGGHGGLARRLVYRPWAREEYQSHGAVPRRLADRPICPAFPDRLAAIVLCAPPATLYPLPGKWAWYGITSLIPHRRFLTNTTRWMFPELTRKKR